MKKIIILGGGITGITCAYELSRMGNEVVLYEANKNLGGLASTVESEGYCYDYGPHEFCTDNPQLVAILRQVLGNDMLKLSQNVSQYFLAKYIDYPIKPLQLLRVLPIRLLSKVAYEVITNRFKRLVYDYHDYSFKRWVEIRFGETMYDLYFGPYTQKVFGISPDSLDPRKASNRISFNSIFDLLIKSASYLFLNKDDFSTTHSPLKHGFYYSRGGIEKICDSMAKAAQDRGARIFLEHKATSIDTGSSTVAFNDGSVMDNFDYLISTIPITELLKLLGLRMDIEPVKFRSIVLVNLKVPFRPLTKNTWIYFPQPEIIFQRLTEYSNIDQSMAPEGCSSVGLEISCFAGDNIWKQSDDQIIDRVYQDLDRIGILPLSTDVEAFVVRQRFGYPIHLTGYLEIVKLLLEPIASLGNVVTTGRQGLFKYCNMNECMEMAIEVAETIERGQEGFNYNLESSWRGAGLENNRIVKS